MSECTHNCDSCGESCKERTSGAPVFTKPHALTNVRKIIAVVSGKGGVGKSLITSLLAVSAQRKKYKCAVLDADVTGPSIPRMFGIKAKASADENGIYPAVSKTGIKIMSLNLLLEHESDPVIWRGPVISGTVGQFWTDVIWGDNDFMFIDMPPGTGDVALTVFQTIPVDGLIIAASPQDMVSMIVEKAVKMAEMMNVPIIGLVENMAYITCPDCGKKIELFGKSHIGKISAEHNLEVLASIPLEPSLAALSDSGNIEDFKGDWLNNAAQKIEELIKSE